MKIHIKYFASLREKAQKSAEEMEVANDESLFRIYENLSSRYGFPLSAKEIKFAVNNEYVADEYQLRENDTVVFIPPVAGG